MYKLFCDLCGKPLNSGESRLFKIKEKKCIWSDCWWQKIDAHDQCIKDLLAHAQLVREEESKKENNEENGE